MNIQRRTQSIVFALVAVLSLSECSKLQDEPKPQASVPETANNIASTTAVTTITTSGYNIEQSLPKGYVKNGTVDYTSYIQAAINKYSNLIFPAFPILVNDNGLVISGSNKTLSFLPGSSLLLKHSSHPQYDIIRIEHCSNIKLINPVIIGDRYNHTGTGEWGMGIGIYSGNNIVVTNPKVSNCFGDGIYIGRAYQDVSSTNVQISNALCSYNRRDGISVCSVNGLTLNSPYCKNTDGTLPMAGICIEPNNSSDEAKNIIINNPKTENNVKIGIQIGLTKMHGAVTKTSNITITNHVDNNSGIGMLVSSYKRADQLNTKEINGSVVLTNPTWNHNPTLNLRATWLREPNLKLTLKAPAIIDMSNHTLTQTQVKSIVTTRSVNVPLTNYQLIF